MELELSQPSFDCQLAASASPAPLPRFSVIPLSGVRALVGSSECVGASEVTLADCPEEQSANESPSAGILGGWGCVMA
jgi:hypothetical protein